MVAIFLSALAVGFSGAMMPGPLLTFTLDKSLNAGSHSGFIIITGHAVLELLLIIFIFLGFDIVLQSDYMQISIGIIGGILLAYMGYNMISGSVKNTIKIEMGNNRTGTKHMMLSGAVISAANPYFLLWWAVIGLGFLIQAYRMFGITGIIVFYIGHITADYLWYGSISVIVGKTRKFIKENLYRIIIAVLGSLLIFFGSRFIYQAIKLMLMS